MSRSRRFPSIPPADPRLEEGRRLFNAGQFFESHEAWESLWHEVAEPERKLLQGMIQLAAACHHLERSNAAGAAYLHARGHAKVAPWLPRHAGLELGEWLAEVDRYLRESAVRTSIEPADRHRPQLGRAPVAG